jgi:hypothetical protein
MTGVWAKLAPGLAERLQLSRAMQPCEVDALWQLCQVEAGLMRSISGGACSLFSEQDVAQLEWLEDLRLYEAQVGGVWVWVWGGGGAGAGAGVGMWGWRAGAVGVAALC